MALKQAWAWSNCIPFGPGPPIGKGAVIRSKDVTVGAAKARARSSNRRLPCARYHDLKRAVVEGGPIIQPLDLVIGQSKYPHDKRQRWFGFLKRWAAVGS